MPPKTRPPSWRAGFFMPHFIFQAPCLFRPGLFYWSNAVMFVSSQSPLRRPRLEGDAILLGKSTLLARRIVVRGFWETETHSGEALSALLSLAYGAPVSAVAPLVKIIHDATAQMTRNPNQTVALLAPLPEPVKESDAILAQAVDLLQRGVEPGRLETALRRAHLKLPDTPDYCPSLRLTDQGVVLGKGTVIASLEDYPNGGTGLAVAGREADILALLSLARDELVDEAKVLDGLGSASRALMKGDAPLAAIALCLIGQPRLEDDRLAKRLSLAASQLRNGIYPGDLLKLYGLPVRRNGQLPDWLWKYDVNQLRHPKGTHEGGRFAPKDASDLASMTPEQKQAELARLSDAHDKAMLAAHTYGENTSLPPGYRQIDPDTPEGQAELKKLGISKDDLSPENSSIHAELFVKDGQYVLAFRGTRPSESQDVVNDVEQGLGLNSEAYEKAIKLARILAFYTDRNLSFTGHSLGGGLASAAAVATGLSATTFNAAGLDVSSIKDRSSTRSRVDAYYVEGEPLSAIQDSTVASLPFVASAVASIATGQNIPGRTTLPLAYGTRHELPASKPSGSVGDYIVNRHSMDWIVSGIEARQQQLQKH